MFGVYCVGYDRCSVCIVWAMIDVLCVAYRLWQMFGVYCVGYDRCSVCIV